MVSVNEVGGVAVALGIGLLIGIERERRKGEGADRGAAGIRTFALIALAGAIAEQVGGIGIAIGGAFTTLAALASYRYSRERDPGLTTEVAMLVVFLLGVLAMREVAFAAGLGVAVAFLLSVKSRVHRFVRHVLTEQELHDAILLTAAAAIVLPLLPDRTLDPWNVLNLRKLWLLAVIVMAINAAGYVALRAFGARTGLLLSGLAGGFVSSTATIANMGAMARKRPELAMACAGGGVVSNVSTIMQLAVIAGALSPELLHALWPAVVASGLTILVFALGATWAVRKQPVDDGNVGGRAFEPRHALVFVTIVAAAMVLSAAMVAWLGEAGLAATVAAQGLADVHAAAASAAQLVAVGKIAPDAATRAIVLALAANSVTKLVLAFVSGGRSYGLRLLPAWQRWSRRLPRLPRGCDWTRFTPENPGGRHQRPRDHSMQPSRRPEAPIPALRSRCVAMLPRVALRAHAEAAIALSRRLLMALVVQEVRTPLQRRSSVCPSDASRSSNVLLAASVSWVNSSRLVGGPTRNSCRD